MVLIMVFAILLFIGIVITYVTSKEEKTVAELNREFLNVIASKEPVPENIELVYYCKMSGALFISTVRYINADHLELLGEL